MTTYIYIPKPYTIAGQEPLVETISSPLTYKSAQVNGTLTPSVSGYMCAYGGGHSLLSDSTTSSLRSKLSAFVSDTAESTATLFGRVIHFAPCTRHHFPSLSKEDWTPDVFSEDVTYHNNMSGTGQFIGRSVIRRSRSVAVRPISFHAPVERMEELQTLAKSMEAAPFYVKVRAPFSTYVMYGWTENPPVVSYSSDFGQATMSFNMRLTA